ncbi:MAG TPA: VOC family protein [Gemmatimonadaceae bacterium]|nr:VOC family protein [Gemmatimonadaceae bacterium]
MPRVIHFEIPADDPQRASQFYGSVFGWQFQRWEGPQDYWLVSTGGNDGNGGAAAPGIDGGMMRRPQPGAGTVNTIDVPSVDEYVSRIQAQGGSVAVPKMAVPGVGWLAYCTDPEGNMFGIMQTDAEAG